MISFSSVNDEINTLFLAGWQASDSVLGYVPDIRWQGVQETDIPTGYWVRVSKQTVKDAQASLSNCEGKIGQKKYTTSGLYVVQLFCPKSDTQSFDRGQQLAEIARNALRGKTTPSKIWFRNGVIKELPDEELYIRFNIITEIEYDELG